MRLNHSLLSYLALKDKTLFIHSPFFSLSLWTSPSFPLFFRRPFLSLPYLATASPSLVLSQRSLLFPLFSFSLLAFFHFPSLPLLLYSSSPSIPLYSSFPPAGEASRKAMTTSSSSQASTPATVRRQRPLLPHSLFISSFCFLSLFAGLPGSSSKRTSRDGAVSPAAA